MRVWLTSLLILTLAAVVGCAGSLPLVPSTDDTHRDRLARREQAVEEFDSRRADAQLQSALERWRQGDIAACQAQLEQLLRDDPRNGEARRLLADVYLVQQQVGRATDQLRQLLALDDTDHQAHHSLGLLLMGVEDDVQAAIHLRRAVELSPDCELYGASLAALLAASPQAAAPISGHSAFGESNVDIATTSGAYY